MPNNSKVPRVQFTPEGLVLPNESAILAGVLSDMDAAFGGGLNPALETPQGQLAPAPPPSSATRTTSLRPT